MYIFLKVSQVTQILQQCPDPISLKLSRPIAPNIDIKLPCLLFFIPKSKNNFYLKIVEILKNLKIQQY